MLDYKTFKTDLDRKQFVQALAATTLGVSTLSNNQLAAASSSSKKKVLRVFLGGGVSHLDSFDPKPKSPQVMGDTKVIRSNTGEQISEYFPKMAKMMDKFSLIRSMHSPDAAHERAHYIMETSYTQLGTIKHPNLGAWMQKMNGSINENLPPSVGINTKHGGGFLGTTYDQFYVSRPENALNGLVMKDPRSKSNARLLKLMADIRRDFHKNNQFAEVEDYRKYYNESMGFMHSKDLEAFDINKEDKKTLAKYKSKDGNKFLLARRLLEANVQYVSISIGGWDDHKELWGNEAFPLRAKNFDDAFSTFLADFYARGMHKDTIISVNTEFGRTPSITGESGRGHYNKAFWAILAGAGVKGGTVYGKTSETGSKPIENPVSVTDFNATLATLAGLNLEKEIYSPTNRPFTVAREGKIVKGVMA